jgi:serine protease
MKVKTLIVAGLILALMAGLLVPAGVMAATSQKADFLIGFHVAPGPAEQALVRGAGGDIYWQFAIVNVIAAHMTPRAADALARNPAVAYVEPDGRMYALEQTVPWGIDRVFGDETYPFATWSGSTGQGISVAVLDTGICTTHPDVVAVGGQRFYTRGMRLVQDGNYEDGHGHGTHVAGTIAALDNSFGVVGVAPAVSLYAVKVLDDSGSGSVSAIAAGIDWAVKNGIRVLNMSLGSDTHSQTLQNACDNAYAKGHLVVASAGNSGNADGTGDNVGYPARYESVIAVAASNINDQRASFSSTGPAVELIAPGDNVLSTIPWTDENSLTVDGVSYQANWIENAARTDASGVTAPLVDGGLATSTNSAWSGKVVLVQRGEISFYDKVRNVQNSGGVAAVIYNNEPGNFFGTLGDGYSSTIPAITLSQEDGQWLVANKLGANGTVVSLYDPNTPGYAAWAGTSMASPHVAGVAALVWAADPTLTNVQVRSILQSTAEDLSLPADHQGYGLVRADLAVRAVTQVEPPVTYTITATAGTGGTIDPSGEVIVSEGDNQTFTIAAYAGYEISDVLVDNVSVGAVSSYTFSNVTANHTIHAEFASVPTYKITASAGEGGTIDPSGEVIVNEGDSQTFSITAATGYEIDDVVVDGGSVGAVSSYTFSNVTADHTIHATFKAASVATTVRVESITYATRARGRHLDITLFLLDNLDQPVAGASVSATLHRDDGSSWNFAGTSGSNGTVVFTLNNHGSGCYNTVVTAVTASGFTWDGVTPTNSYCK